MSETTTRKDLQMDVACALNQLRGQLVRCLDGLQAYERDPAMVTYLVRQLRFMAKAGTTAEAIGEKTLAWEQGQAPVESGSLSLAKSEGSSTNGKGS